MNNHRPTINHATAATNLADILERVLDKGIVIAGDIKISIADIELISIKLRLLVSSVDKAKEIGINWWETDPYLSTTAKHQALEAQSELLNQRIQQLEEKLQQLNGK
ncbi:MAG: gas vesicle protein [Flammeovirgaceae bacterium]